MKTINQSVWAFDSVRWGAYAALIVSILNLVLEEVYKAQVLPDAWQTVLSIALVLLATVLGKKKYQPELHQATNDAQIQSFAGSLPEQKKFVLGARSLKNLEGVHPDLVKVVKRAIQITECDFTVIEGLRTKQRQAELVKKGASQTSNSRHLTGHAVDLGAWVNGTVSWDWKYYYQIEKAMKQAAKELNIQIEWGGDWKRFKDGPHYQLPWSKK